MWAGIRFFGFDEVEGGRDRRRKAFLIKTVIEAKTGFAYDLRTGFQIVSTGLIMHA